MVFCVVFACLNVIEITHFLSLLYNIPLLFASLFASKWFVK